MTTEALIDRYAEGLSSEQEAAFRELMPKLLAPGSAKYKLEGYAGTGKTYVAARIGQVLQEKGLRVVAAAPTHRATAEIRRALTQPDGPAADSLEARSIETCTLPALLGLQLKADGQGDYQLVPEGRSQLPRGGVVICDEGSMVGEETMGFVQAAGQGVRWLFLGDPAQLPPVGEPPSGVFDLPGPALTRVVRQAKDNPIIEFTRRIREGLPHLSGEHVSYDGEKGIAATRSAEAFLQSAVRLFQSEAFAEDPATARILAYRNVVVDRYNERVRWAVYGAEAEAYVEGEWLVARETWMPADFPVIINSEPLKVLEARKGTDSFALGGQWAVWRLTVQTEGRGGQEITVLADEDRPRYQEKMDDYKKEALRARADGREEDASEAWKNFYRLKEQYAQVGYGFASTVHKSQGGTYENVFVDYRDLSRSREPERSALRYVAGSRPRQRLALLV